MLLLHDLSTLGLSLRVNGVDIKAAGLWDNGNGVTLVIEDPWIGMFPVNEEFLLAMQSAGDQRWCSVSLHELKQRMIVSVAVAEKTLGASERLVAVTVLGAPEEKKAGGYSAVLQSRALGQVTEILYQAGVAPLVIASPATAGDRFHGCVVIRVRGMLRARIWLRRAGFHQDPNVRAVLYSPDLSLQLKLIEDGRHWPQPTEEQPI
jgi:hypothetical protein